MGTLDVFGSRVRVGYAGVAPPDASNCTVVAPSRASTTGRMSPSGCGLRRRLASVSWFRGALCEKIARRSNQEDGCRGRFRESRYGCRALADEAAILICGVYVDLNPMRAGEVSAPEEAIYTSAYDRIEGRKLRVWEAGEDRCAGASAVEVPGSGGDRVMPPDGWFCELRLEEGPQADVRHGSRSATPRTKAFCPWGWTTI